MKLAISEKPLNFRGSVAAAGVEAMVARPPAVRGASVPRAPVDGKEKDCRPGASSRLRRLEARRGKHAGTAARIREANPVTVIDWGPPARHDRKAGRHRGASISDGK